MTPDAVWYHDETSLLEELKGHVGSVAAPMIPGLSDLRELRRGGQGIVYSALQQSTRRRVAVKLLLDHASSPSQRARFQREIDLVASFSHPGIVSIFDSGMTSESRPYLVMEFVEGLPLHEHILTSKPSIDRIVELFRDITTAVNYAHQRGVIHRDLKPANIRISPDGRPHVLDFGLAKIVQPTNDAVPDSLLISASGQFFGSLPWASPEQADGRPNDVDVRSDIYAIGVMLYDALTGEMPYAVNDSLKQTLTNILEAQPPRPSTINSRINRDLETIMLKALAKDPGRRYQSAGALAEDLTHFLKGEPIDARRDSAIYVLFTTARRHRVAVTFASLMLTSLMGFTIVLGVLYQRAVAGERLAEQRREVAEQQSERAERRFNDVRDMANTFMFDMYDQLIDIAGSRPARETLVNTALQYLASLSEEAHDDPTLTLELAAAYRRVGDIQGNPYQPNLGDTVGAMKSFHTALQLNHDALRLIGHDPAVSREIADTLNLIGDMHLWSGQRDQALTRYREAMAMLEELLERQPDDAGARRVLAAAHINIGDMLVHFNDTQGMLEHYRAGKALIAELANSDPHNHRDTMNLAICHTKIGFALASRGDLDESLSHLLMSLQLNEQVANADPDNANAQRGVSISLNQVGAVLVAMQRFEEAFMHYERSLRIARSMHNADPQDTLAISDLAFTLNKVGELHSARQQHSHAAQRYLAALELRNHIATNDPDNASFQRDLSTSHSLIAGAYALLASDEQIPTNERLQHHRDAIAHYQRCRDILLDMHHRGVIMMVDESRPEQLEAEILRLQTELQQLETSSHS